MIGDPVQLNESFALILLYEHEKSYFPNLENSWTLFQQYALIEKQNKLFNRLITNIKKKTYIKTYHN